MTGKPDGINDEEFIALPVINRHRSRGEPIYEILPTTEWMDYSPEEMESMEKLLEKEEKEARKDDR